MDPTDDTHDADGPPPPDTDTETDTMPPVDTDTETDTMPPVDTDTETDTSDQIAGCECIVDQVPVDMTESPESPTCGESLCPSVRGECGDVGCGEEDGAFVLDDAAALECALTALRDRTPGVVQWSWSANAGQYTSSGYFLVNEDGTAVYRRSGWSDLDYEVSDAALGELPPPEHFDGCLAEPDDFARFDCLRDGFDSSLGICDEGWSYSDI
jgi:hypothetical protein